MENTTKRNELKHCKRVDLKLKTRDPIVRQLTAFYCKQIELNAPKRTRRKTIEQAQKATHAILANLFRARAAGNPVVAVSLCEGKYASKTNSKISYKSMLVAIDALVGIQNYNDIPINPLVIRFKGFGRPSKFKERTKLKLNESSLEFWIDQIEPKESRSKEVHMTDDSSVSELSAAQKNELGICVKDNQYKEYNKDSDSNNIYINQCIDKKEITPITSRLNFLYYTEEPRSVISLRDHDGISIKYEVTREIKKMERAVTQYNEYLSGHCVQLFVPDKEYDGLLKLTRTKLEQRRQARDFSVTRSQLLGEEAISLYRVFNRGTFDCGGRHYGAYWQNTPRAYRPFLTIDGHPTVELDFKSMHPTMIYHQMGLPVEGDPYELDGFPRGYRDTVKSAFMTLLNAKEETRRLRSLETLQYPPGWGPVSLREEVERHHAPIREVFRSDMGVKLQRLDSDIASIVMRVMREKHGALALPVHDSFIVTEDREHELEAVMRSAYAEVMKSADIKIDSKPRLADVLNDKDEASPAFLFLRRVEGVVDDSGTPNHEDYSSRLGPIASDYKMYLDRLSNAIDRSPKKIQTVDC